MQPKSQAEVAQLVEHNLAKVGVASPSLVFRSVPETRKIASLFLHCYHIGGVPQRDGELVATTEKVEVARCFQKIGNDIEDDPT